MNLNISDASRNAPMKNIDFSSSQSETGVVTRIDSMLERIAESQKRVNLMRNRSFSRIGNFQDTSLSNHKWTIVGGVVGSAVSGLVIKVFSACSSLKLVIASLGITFVGALVGSRFNIPN